LTDVFFRGYGQWIAGIVDKVFFGSNQEVSGDISRRYRASGVFRLTEEDDITFRQTNNFDILDVAMLLPSKHPDDEFSRKDRVGGITSCGTEKVYFYIDENQPESIILKIAEPYKTTIKEDITENERNSMLKLIIGMAIDAYDYDPTSKRNSATGEKNGISSRLSTHNIIVSDDTIRKYLSQAKNIL